MEFPLPSHKNFSYLSIKNLKNTSKNKSSPNRITHLLKHGVNSIMQDWNILIEHDFILNNSCSHCTSKLPISIGLTKNWLIIASQQKFYTNLKDGERNGWPFCNRGVKLAGRILNLENIIPRTKIKISLGQNYGVGEKENDDFPVLTIENCCNEKVEYRPVFENFKNLESYEQVEEIKHHFYEKWKKILKDVPESEESSSKSKRTSLLSNNNSDSTSILTNDKIRQTLDVFNSWTKSNNIYCLIEDVEGHIDVANNFVKICDERINKSMKIVDNPNYFEKKICQDDQKIETGPRHSKVIEEPEKPEKPEIPPPPPLPPMELNYQVQPEISNKNNSTTEDEADPYLTGETNSVGDEFDRDIDSDRESFSAGVRQRPTKSILKTKSNNKNVHHESPTRRKSHSHGRNSVSPRKSMNSHHHNSPEPRKSHHKRRSTVTEPKKRWSLFGGKNDEQQNIESPDPENRRSHSRRSRSFR